MKMDLFISRTIPSWLGSLGLWSLLAFSGTLLADAPPNVKHGAAPLLPPTVVAFAELSNLDEVVDLILRHPLRERILALPAYASVAQSGPLRQLQVGLATFEARMELPWQAALSKLTDGGVTLAFDGSTGGTLLLIHSSEQDVLKRFREFLLTIRQLQNGGMAAREGKYRDFTTYSLNDNLKLVQMNDWLMLTNKPELGRLVIDQYLDHRPDSLQSKEQYRQAMLQLDASGAEPVFSAYVDIAALRNEGLAKVLFKEKTDNFFGEVVLGGILANIRHTPFATASLDVQRDGLELQISTLHQREWEAPREYYFGTPELAAAPPLLEVPNRLFAFSLHRDLSKMWLSAGELLSDRANDGLAKADSQLTTFFSGQDFGEDILGTLKSDIQIVGASQDFSGKTPLPAIKLPAFAVQFVMKNPAETQPQLRRVFQSFIGFLNITGGTNGQPQFDLGMETQGKTQLITASYVPDPQQRESTTAPITFNFSPTMAFAGDRVILASADALARELASREEFVAAGSVGTSMVTNTRGMLDGLKLKDILLANESQLVANSMLSKGHSKESAKKEVDLMFELLGYLADAHLNLEVGSDQLQLTISLGVDSEGGK